ncbi:hypothetical protein FBU31_005266 [Coemansia sp. 'formosensis']|nr:hypothetical protein FBU31_005266 [Coemansia sp. 'formosensis']
MTLPRQPLPRQLAAPAYPTSEGRPVSTSTEAPSPQKTRAPASPFSGPFQHITPLTSVLQSPQMRHRTRGQSISSAVASTSSRRRDSRADAKSPYSRPPTDPDPQTPRSPKSPVSPQSPKRTYRRHPKKDPNAPEKWRSAYQLFRDDVNRELQGQDIPFSEMSKIHSKRWTQLSSDQRATYVERSKIDKQEYKQKMELYEQTLEFKVMSMVVASLETQ